MPLLAESFLRELGRRENLIKHFTRDALDHLMSLDWPGNIRELENIIERALILSRNGVLDYGDWIPVNAPGIEDSKMVTRLEDVEKEHIIQTLKKTGWKVSGEKGAAKILGLNPTTLEARMKKLGIKRETQSPS